MRDKLEDFCLEEIEQEEELKLERAMQRQRIRDMIIHKHVDH